MSDGETQARAGVAAARSERPAAACGAQTDLSLWSGNALPSDRYGAYKWETAARVTGSGTPPRISAWLEAVLPMTG